MSISVRGCVGFLVWVGLTASCQGQRCVLAKLEVTSDSDSSAARVYVQQLRVALLAQKGVVLLERSRLEDLLQEKTLQHILHDGQAESAESFIKDNQAQVLLIPSLLKVDRDYLLALRSVDFRKGNVLSCQTRSARLISRFDQAAKSLVTDVFSRKLRPSDDPSDIGSGSQSPGGSDDGPSEDVIQLRDLAAKAGASELFPSLWQRCQKMYRDLPKASPGVLRSRYLGLIQLCAVASKPPEGMVFIPGGYVKWPIGEKPLKLWVEGFFIDTHETTVEQYESFLGSDSPVLSDLARPITRNLVPYWRNDLPVTGVNHQAASAYASWRDASLPTALQWLRAATYRQDGPWPCGGRDQAAKANLVGKSDGFLTLAPAKAPGADVSPGKVKGLTGNVREWTSTWYGKDNYLQSHPDRPEEPKEGTMKIVAGGSWRTGLEEAKYTHLGKVRVGEAFDDCGLRCVRPLWKSGMQAGLSLEGSATSDETLEGKPR